MSAPVAYLVKLEFSRVQTYLFAVNELKAMIGGNALLGEVLRGRLANGDFARGDSLPSLARHGDRPSALPPGVLPGLGLPDPDPLTDRDSDDPATAYALGVLVRDGGHFHAVFPDREAAVDFVQRARRLIARRLPGLLLKARLGPLGGEEEEEEATADPGADLAELPQFQVCEVTGQDPAAVVHRAGGEARRVSQSVATKREQADRFDDGRSNDVLGLLRGGVLEVLGLGDLEPERRRDLFPADFSRVARTGYLAVVAADGNSVGSRSAAWRNQGTGDYLSREAHGERFFHAMRVAVRKSLMAALKETFGRVAQEVRASPSAVLPFRLLMLGGDDLLLVCDAAYALSFVVHYAKTLHTHPLPDTKPLDVGVGVAIVKKTFPFHRAHQLAEQLQSSAKRLARRGGTGSTVDWLAISEAWHDDLDEVRRRDALLRRAGPKGEPEELSLTARPYRILSASTPGVGLVNSLEDLRHAAERAVTGRTEGEEGARAARSQLMALAHAVRHGRLQADWAARLLPGDLRRSLVAARILRPVGDDGVSAWQGDGPATGTLLLDFLEVSELERLRLPRRNARGTAQHA